MALDITLLSQGLLSTIVDGGFYPMKAYNRVLKAAVYGTVKPRSMDQSGISLNLRTGPTGHATLFNQ